MGHRLNSLLRVRSMLATPPAGTGVCSRGRDGDETKKSPLVPRYIYTQKSRRKYYNLERTRHIRTYNTYDITTTVIRVL